MSFDKALLPESIAYFESEGFEPKGRGAFRYIACPFHGGSDSLRFNVQEGYWLCMACGEKGGDILSFRMKHHGEEFIDAARALNAWTDDGKPVMVHKAAALPPRAALAALNFEAIVCAVAAGNIAKGVALTEEDRRRLIKAANRINHIAGDYQHGSR